MSERVGNFGGLCSGEVGSIPGMVFERPFLPLRIAALDPVADDPSSKRISIPLSRVCVDLAVDRE